MARRDCGDAVKVRAKRLFEALLAYANDEFEDGDRISIEFNWKSEKQLVVRAKRRVLEELTFKDKYEGKLTKEQVREALNRLKDHLDILEDNRTSIKGAEDWHFTLKLWHKDKEANLRQFDIEWENKKSPKSKAVAKKTAPQTDNPSVARNIPPTSAEEFVGREQEILEICKLFQNNATVAVVGMGGVGKTELVTQYARQHMQTYAGGVCWLSARGVVGIQIVEFAKLKFKIALREDWDLEYQIKFCWENWPVGNVLIVFDDVTDYKEQVKPFLPPPELDRFKVLLTTRYRFGSQLAQLQLEVLKPLAAMKLLKSRVGRERLKSEPWVARRLCKWLGYLPLGLELAGRYFEQQSDLSLEKLLSRLEKKRLEHEAICKPDPLMRYELGVAAAFDLSWDRLDENARSVGYWLSLYTLAPIPLSLKEIENDEEQEAWEKGISNLISLHLLQRFDKKTYRLHPLIRQFFQQKLDGSAEASDVKCAFAAAMVAAAKRIPHRPVREDIINLSPAIPHIEEVANRLNEYLGDEDLLVLLSRLGTFYYLGQGFYQQAELWLKQCKEVAESRLGLNHPDLAIHLNNLAELYRSQGRYSDAEPLYLQAIDIGKRSLRLDHPDLASHLNNLALLYRSQGRYSDAEPLYLQAIEIGKRSLPPNHPSLATYLNNLAALYRSQGRYSDRLSIVPASR